MADPNTCMYCIKSEKYQDLLTPIADLRVCKLMLFKEQNYKGRCVLYYNKGHKEEVFELTDEEKLAVMQDLAQAAQAIKKAFGAAKINIGSYGDLVPHMHFHICPKYPDLPDFGGTFAMNAAEPKYVSEEEKAQIIAKIKENL